MRIRVLSFISVAATAFCCPGTSYAQSLVPPAAVQAKQIHIDVQVKDADNKPTTGLSAADFTLLDNKVQRPIESVAEISGHSAPTEVVIVVDAVNTPFSAVSYQRDQIEKYLHSNDGVLSHPTTLAILTDKSLQMFPQTTTNGAVLADGLQHYEIGLREIGRSQGFYGASDRMTISLDALQRLIALESKRPGRKLLLWVSPGWPLLSGPEIELSNKQHQQIYQNVVSLSTALREAGVTLYSLNSWGPGESLDRSSYYETFVDGVKKPGDSQLGNLGLQVLATRSGGLVLNTSDVSGMIKTCVADADHYYRLTFSAEPTDHPAAFHQLQVKLAAAGLQARTRQEYYSQP
jgi:VWFA-related protein